MLPAADLQPDNQRVESAAGVARLERSIVRAVNVSRRRHGLPRLKVSRGLRRVAASHAADLANASQLSHASSNGTSFGDRVRTVTRARVVGETIAATPVGSRPSALAIVKAWLDSPAHRRALLSRSFRRVGVAGAEGPGSTVVTADFASGG